MLYVIIFCVCVIYFVFKEIGKNIYSLKDVVDEIRDKPTKRSLAFLPYKLNFKEPLPEHVSFGNNNFYYH